jgi:hypothetical protein
MDLSAVNGPSTTIFRVLLSHWPVPAQFTPSLTFSLARVSWGFEMGVPAAYVC